MASFVAATSGTRYGDGDISVTLNGSGSDRAIVVIAVAKTGAGGSTFTGAAFGSDSAAIVDTDTQAVDGSYSILGVAIFTDGQHPGSGAQNLNLTWSSAANVSVTVLEFSGWSSQDSSLVKVARGKSLAATGTKYSETVTGESGNPVVAFFAGVNTSSFTASFAYSSNLTSVAEVGTNSAYVKAAYDASAASASEVYEQTYTLDSGADGAGVHYGVVVLSVATASTTIDTPMTPGGTSVLTYSDFDAAPTGVVTATPLDGNGDPVSGFTPLTYSGTVSDTDTAGVHSGTVTVNWPALVDGETTLPFGTNNVRLSITS